MILLLDKLDSLDQIRLLHRNCTIRHLKARYHQDRLIGLEWQELYSPPEGALPSGQVDWPGVAGTVHWPPEGALPSGQVDWPGVAGTVHSAT